MDFAKSDFGEDADDRVICTVTTDMATYDANTQIAFSEGKQANIDKTTTDTALDNVHAYSRHVVQGVSLQGIGAVDVAVTFVTDHSARRNRARLSTI